MTLSKKVSFLIFVTTLILQCAPNHAYAQSTSEGYKSYLESLSRFNDSRKTFETSRSRYLAFQTVQSRDSAIKDAKMMLENGTNTLGRYVGIVGNNTTRLRTVNEYASTKSLILDDLQIHGTFLLNLVNTMPINPNIEEVNTYSESLSTRYGYVRSTVTQAAAYYDIITLLDQLADLKILLSDFDSFLLQFPADNSQSNLIKQNMQELNSKLALQETEIYKLLQTIYPQPTTNNTQPQPTASRTPAFQGGLAFNPAIVQAIRGELNTILNLLKQNINSTREVYKEL